MAKLYWKSTCTSCRSARTIVRELDGEVEERNYSKSPLTKAELTELVGLVPLEELINFRHEIAKTNAWKEKLPSKTAFIAAALEENNLIRRPVLINGSKVVVGADEDAIRALLAT